MASGGPLGSKVFLGMGADTKEWGWVRRGWCVEKVRREKESCMHAKIWQSSLRTDGGRRSPCKQGCYRTGDEPGEMEVEDKENGNSLPEP